MKKMLMISYYYPPLNDVGVLRSLGFSKHLPDFGWEPYVLTIKNPDRSYCLVGNSFRPNNTKVFYSRSLFNLNSVVWKINGLTKLLLKVIGKDLKKNVFHDLICIPDVFIGWIIPCFLRGLYLNKKFDINVIYVSCRPFSSALTGVFLKKVLKKPLILDFRDPMSFPYIEFDNDRLGKFRHRLMRKLEKYTLKNVDRFIVTTDETRDEYLSLYPFLKGKIDRIYNGFLMETKASDDKPTYDKFTIIYVGNFYYNSISSDKFFQSLKEIVVNKLIPEEKFQFLYIGGVNKKNNWLEKVGDKYNIKNIIVAPGQVSREESLQAMSKASLLLLRIIPPCISTKLYEGLAIGIPFLATINKGEVEQLIKRYSSHSYIITSDAVDDIVSAIVDAYKKWDGGNLKKIVNKEYIQQFNKKELTKEFVEIVERLYPKLK